ncbi:stabilizer of axonemal microtubules 3-like [Pelodytes ibericus]
MVLEREQDCQLIVIGVGLKLKSRPHVPPAQIKSTVCKPLPLTWKRKNEPTRSDRLKDPNEQTSGSSLPSYPTPPRHRTAYYNKDFCGKGDQKHWGSPLKPRTITMNDDYLGLPAKPTLTTFHSGPKPFALKNQLNKGPSQHVAKMVDKRTICFPDIFTKTTTRDSIPFPAKELDGPPKKDVRCPKIRGYGIKKNLPEQTLRPPTSKQDTLMFPNIIKLPILPRSLNAAVNRKTLGQDGYQRPLDLKRRNDVYDPIKCPLTMLRHAPLPPILAGPKTENKKYGSKQLITI